ncbi:hypothetical protein HanPI659440_Chr13g0513611 [Helianthus annuus]|nr:hypothetical protein HanPI659440_Chr13g0513611 [Helianthus annuus]
MLTKDLNRVMVANKANGKRSLSGQALPGVDRLLWPSRNIKMKRDLNAYREGCNNNDFGKTPGWWVGIKHMRRPRNGNSDGKLKDSGFRVITKR